jgi:Transposase DDE domain
VLDWKAQQEHCPQVHPSVHWRPRHDVSGDPLIRIRFDGATCRACPTRQECTSARALPRQLTVRLHTHHEAIQTAQQRQETPEFKAQYALRAGVESSLSHGTRCFDLRRSRYIGLARTHLRQLLNAIAMNVVRVDPWANAGGSRDTWLNSLPIPCHARRCSVRGDFTNRVTPDSVGEVTVVNLRCYGNEFLQGNGIGLSGLQMSYAGSLPCEFST